MAAVRYLKALHGIGGEPVVCGSERTEKSWEQLVEEIGDTDDLLAVHVTQKAKGPEYRKYRSRIGAFIQIRRLATRKTTRDYGRKCLTYDWNKSQWPIGVPVKYWIQIPEASAPLLKAIVLKHQDQRTWDSIKAALRGGPIDLREKYPFLEKALTELYQELKPQLNKFKPT
jgi:hypothetical protein